MIIAPRLERFSVGSSRFLKKSGAKTFIPLAPGVANAARPDSKTSFGAFSQDKRTACPALIALP
jgi:hypothetical protein